MDEYYYDSISAVWFLLSNCSKFQIDYAVATLANFISERQKQCAKHASEIHRVREINAQLKKLIAALQQMVPTVQELNEQLPKSERLPPLELGRFIDDATNRNYLPDGTEEQKVVDSVYTEETDGKKEMDHQANS